MNERIQELDNQAYEYALAESKGGTNICAPGSDYFLAMEKAKFAELIVRECIWEVVKDNEVPHNIQVLIGERFKQHFGVEE